MTRRTRPMPKNTKPASSRIFYRRVENWDIWKVLLSGPAIGLYCVIALLTITLQYSPL